MRKKIFFKRLVGSYLFCTSTKERLLQFLRWYDVLVQSVKTAAMSLAGCVWFWVMRWWYVSHCETVPHCGQQFCEVVIAVSDSVKWSLRSVITGSIAHSTKHRYISYSEGDFEVSHPAGVTCCIGIGPLLHARFHPHWCKDKGIGPQNWNFCWGFTKIWNINALQGRIPCTIFMKFLEFVPRFKMR